MNTLYTKIIDGSKVTKPRKNIVLKIEKDGQYMQVFNPTEEMLLEDGWEVYTVPELTAEQILANAKRDKKYEINHYDSSSSVNEFYIQDLPVWLDKSTRAGLKLRFEAEIAMGKTDTTLWYNNMQFPLSLENAMKMLYAIELYASACYDNTQAHLANVDALDTLDAVLEYDYTAGYPDKLNF